MRRQDGRAPCTAAAGSAARRRRPRSARPRPSILPTSEPWPLAQPRTDHPGLDPAGADHHLGMPQPDQVLARALVAHHPGEAGAHRRGRRQQPGTDVLAPSRRRPRAPRASTCGRHGPAPAAARRRRRPAAPRPPGRRRYGPEPDVDQLDRPRRPGPPGRPGARSCAYRTSRSGRPARAGRGARPESTPMPLGTSTATTGQSSAVDGGRGLVLQARPAADADDAVEREVVAAPVGLGDDPPAGAAQRRQPLGVQVRPPAATARPGRRAAASRAPAQRRRRRCRPTRRGSGPGRRRRAEEVRAGDGQPGRGPLHQGARRQRRHQRSLGRADLVDRVRDSHAV